jgi:predicted alpha/beta-fold hydrolase
MNLTRRFYHSGETGDLAMTIERLRQENPGQPIGLVGVSLGGNVLLKYLGENGTRIHPEIKAAVAVSVPFDLERASRHIDKGFAKVYQRHFIRSLKRKAAEKLAKFPDLIEPERLDSLQTMFEFDDALTGPLHGFRDAKHYYSSSSSIGYIDRISIPTLLLSSVDDPFLPAAVLNDVRTIAEGNPSLHLEFTPRGGHVGFISGHNPWRPSYYAEKRACDFLANHATRRIALRSEDPKRGTHVTTST